MRSLKVPGILMFVLALGSIATAGENKMGDGEVSQVTFVARFALEQRCRPQGIMSYTTRWRGKTIPGCSRNAIARTKSR